MNYHVYENQMPRLTLSYDELKDIVQTLLSRISGTFDFNGFVKTIANHLVQHQIGFKFATNTSYNAEMDWNDVSVIREIMWDLIVLRYITVGGYGVDTWPSLTVTQRGKDFFSTL